MTNASLTARSLAHVWHPCTQMHLHQHEPLVPLVPIVRGEGVWLIDADGQRYIDAISSWWTNLFGHANLTIGAAIKQQVDQLEHVMLAGFTHQPAIVLAERLAALTRLPHAFFASDGASAVEIALKMAFHFHVNRGGARQTHQTRQTSRTRFIALTGSYHGETLGALGVTDVAVFRDAYAPLIASPIFVDAPTPKDVSLDSHCCDDCVDVAIQQLRSVLQSQGDSIAAMIVEPLVQGAAGMRMYALRYLSEAMRLCREYGVLFIADEIMTGFGRTGAMFACDWAKATDDCRPDLMCLSKGLTGGYLPMSCVMASHEIYQAFDSPVVTRGFLHSHSYTGNPLACAAANATLSIFDNEDVIATNQTKAKAFTDLFRSFAVAPHVRSPRTIGMIWACEIAHEAASHPHFARLVFAAALRQGVVCRPIGNTIYVMPPYVMTTQEFAKALDGIANALTEVLAGARVSMSRSVERMA